MSFYPQKGVFIQSLCPLVLWINQREKTRITGVLKWDRPNIWWTFFNKNDLPTYPHPLLRILFKLTLFNMGINFFN